MIITVAGTKGGVGKSLLACQLASHWHHQGYRVALLDLDVQGTARRFADAAEQQGTPCPTTLAVSGDVRKTLDEQAAVYDILVCDTQGRANASAVRAIVQADLVITPCGPTVEDLDALLASTWEFIEQATALREDLAVLTVRNQWPSRPTAMSAAVEKELITSSLPLARSCLRRLVAFNEASAAGAAVTVTAPRSPAAQDLLTLVEEIEILVGIRNQPTEEVVTYA